MNFSEEFALNVESKSNGSQIIIENDVRLTVLTDRLIRVETGAFTDKPTQKIWYRAFDKPKFTKETKGQTLLIKTERCTFAYNLKKRAMAYIELDGKKIRDFNKGNLGGTYRTLDGTIGPIKTGQGVVSKNGVAVLDDSVSLTIETDGTVAPREKCTDLYFFAYGKAYRESVQAFFSLAGKVPLVPRFCLGNWWSRYKAYTQQEYIALMDRFIDEEIPVTVATIDMDWHWVDVVKKFGDGAKREKNGLSNSFTWDGWTGYSWNTELFPDYRGMLDYLKSKNFKITLNVHPSDGVRSFEDQYESMAKSMGMNPEEKKPIAFDITDKKFISAYFGDIHHPYEEEGVDFWWLDWQQGMNTKLKNLDPLWALNHYHYLDSRRENRRGLILSRYAQPGSHRYPLGFSGDAKVCWPCYEFQVTSTPTATNIGYTWWSHDIGGHHFGKKDDELYLRWLQFGVFSPVNRLHSTSNEFMGKEPWKYNCAVESMAKDWLRLRHRLIPYIYSMNYRTHHEGLGLMEPMYYQYPDAGEAYTYNHQYFFGTEMIAAPVTKKIHPKTNLAPAEIWLPEGRYTDIFTGRIYEGGRVVTMYRGLNSFPVLAKEGAIIPLDMNAKNNISTNPTDMEVLIYRGNSSFNLYEDDGETLDFEKGVFATRLMEVSEKGNNITFALNPYEGDLTAVNEKVNYTLSFRDIAGAEKVKVSVNGESITAYTYTQNKFVTVMLPDITPTDSVTIELKNTVRTENVAKSEAIIELISKFQCGVVYKKNRFENFAKNPSGKGIPSCPAYYKGPIKEIMEMK